MRMFFICCNTVYDGQNMSAKVELGAIDLKIDLFPSATLH